MVVAITGNLASGKSSVLRLLKDKGAVIFDADCKIHAYYRNKRSEVYRRVAKNFPESRSQKGISRKKLASIVFDDPRKLKKLERIVHPVIIVELLRWIKQGSRSRRVYAAEVALLFEKGLQRHFDCVVLVSIKRSLLIQRIVRTRDLSPKAARKRLELYLPAQEKREKADFIVDNNLGKKQLQKEVDLLWKKLNQK